MKTTIITHLINKSTQAKAKYDARKIIKRSTLIATSQFQCKKITFRLDPEERTISISIGDKTIYNNNNEKNNTIVAIFEHLTQISMRKYAWFAQKERYHNKKNNRYGVFDTFTLNLDLCLVSKNFIA